MAFQGPQKELVVTLGWDEGQRYESVWPNGGPEAIWRIAGPDHEPATDPAAMAKVYAEVGIDITDHQDARVVVESRPRVVESGVGGAFRSRTTRVAALVTVFEV